MAFILFEFYWYLFPFYDKEEFSWQATGPQTMAKCQCEIKQVTRHGYLESPNLEDKKMGPCLLSSVYPNNSVLNP